MDRYASFVALDLETTGSDPGKDDVIEIGAVRVENGNLTTQFSQLIQPRSPLPFHISQLTGLEDEDLRGEPRIEEVVPRLVSFLEASPIALHSASFDLSFLGKHLSLGNEVWDTLELSRILIPWAKDHKLESLLSVFSIRRAQKHRALKDARGVAELFLKLLKYWKSLDPRSLQLVNELTEPTNWGLKPLFRDAGKRALKVRLGKRLRGEVAGSPPPNVIEKQSEGRGADPSSTDSYFGPSGPLSSLLEGYEYREGQAEMAREVARGFEEEALLVCEAGTGIGKSLAYLIPSLLWSSESEDRVIVSTNTKNLQDQLFYKDIPLLLECLDFGFKAVLLKGRANYLCLRKWSEITSNPDVHLTGEERISLLPLVLWVERTQAGEISENRGFSLYQNRDLWRKLRCEPRDCLGGECRLHNRCFANRARSEAQSANLVVVNHSLLFSDLSADNKVLGPYDRLVVDEAHNLEKAATDTFGKKVSLWKIKIPLSMLYARRPVEKGLIPFLERRVAASTLEPHDKEFLFRGLDRVKDSVIDAQESAETFFERLAKLVPSPYGRLRYWAEHRILSELGEESKDLTVSLRGICQGVGDLHLWVSELGPNKIEGYKEIRADLEGRMEELKEVLDEFGILTGAEEQSLCYWVEVSDGDSAALRGAPIEVGPLLTTSLYPQLKTAVFTSATLKVGPSFDYFLRRTGLDLVSGARVRDKAFDSPFDFPNQVLAVLPAYLPVPGQEEFAGAVGELLKRVILGTRRGALVLLTSYRLLSSLYEGLKEEFERGRISLLAQGLTGSRTKLIEQFREERSSALLGTDSFWEGVDVPGEALEILVISKLPFPVPDEPIVEARSEVIQARGGDSFGELMVPQTVIRFRQGFGRLIRNQQDRGVVLVLDNRVVNKEYGRLFLSSLPVEVDVCRSEEEVASRVGEWWS